MSGRNANSCCDEYNVSDVLAFLRHRDTTVSEAYRTHWQNLGTATRWVKISQDPLPNSEEIRTREGLAHDLFEKAVTNGSVQCQNLFSQWENGTSFVVFRMTDGDSQQNTC